MLSMLTTGRMPTRTQVQENYKHDILVPKERQPACSLAKSIEFALLYWVLFCLLENDGSHCWLCVWWSGGRRWQTSIFWWNGIWTWDEMRRNEEEFVCFQGLRPRRNSTAQPRPQRQSTPLNRKSLDVVGRISNKRCLLLPEPRERRLQ